MFRTAGVYLFFGLDALLTAVHERLRGRSKELLLASDHPPSQLRAEAVNVYLQDRGAQSAMEVPMFVLKWFSQVQDEVSVAVAQELESIAEQRKALQVPPGGIGRGNTQW